ncbi:MAG TPA: hypothetical protein VKH37_09295, partial [Ferruginibacter sp.]|nr:hypothetical protein [Ferruginibacter sp.]
RVTKKDKDNKDVEVEELKEGWFPIALERGKSLGMAATVWKLKGTDPRPWADDKIFYTEDADSKLIPLTAAIINEYWDTIYTGFEKLSGPDWTINCLDYAMGGNDEGETSDAINKLKTWTKSGDYNSESTLTELLDSLTVGTYVANMGSHGIKIEVKSKGNFKISQKDQESAVYGADCETAAAATKIIAKGGSGTIYKKA